MGPIKTELRAVIAHALSTGQEAYSVELYKIWRKNGSLCPENRDAAVAMVRRVLGDMFREDLLTRRDFKPDWTRWARRYYRTK